MNKYSKITKNMSIKKYHKIIISLPLIFSTNLHALEADPGDYTALPEGTNLGLIYGQFTERDSFYSDGNKLAENGLSSDVGLLRFVHFTKLGDYIVDPQFVLPFGHLHAKDAFSALGSTGGVGDLVLGMTTWLVNNPESNTYFGITPWLHVPTGNYDNNKALNLGENRWKFEIQAGFITGLTDKLLLDVVADATFHGDNDDFGVSNVTMEQDMSFSLQTYLRYNITPTLDIRGGVIVARSGETTVAGIDSNDANTTTRGRLGIGWFINPTTQILAGYGQDFKVDNGFKETSRYNLRLLTVF